MKKQTSKKKHKKTKEEKLREEFFKIAKIPKKEQHKFLVLEV